MLSPYADISDSEINLKDIALKEEMIEEKILSDFDTLCRLCVKTISTDHVFLDTAIKDNGFQQVFEKNLSEVVSFMVVNKCLNELIQILFFLES